ncbi:uncharacterized protein LOC106768308 [Vigna radiata var. radiata]|uniref:Uncharacterized protein LOC106768308 n=1 Tax=Vigna radiata var. radiata TaxID=3916 RepID=A0A1S3US28_VIGRR|nr:uncharacterized protein LOC106768308 [Vigna radiata var. radiata]
MDTTGKRKKDGKTVKEAHEHLKVGNEERIHVYYAHGQDNSNFVRRCYWLLDNKLQKMQIVVMIILDLTSVMAILGIQLNAVSIVNLIMAIGIVVEFCVHIVHAFTVSLGDRNQRAKTALCTMGASVFRCITSRCTWPWLSLATVSILRSLESKHTNQLCSISHCDSNSLLNEASLLKRVMMSKGLFQWK